MARPVIEFTRSDDGARLAWTQRGRSGRTLVDVPGVLLGGLTSPAVDPDTERFYSVLARHARVVSFDFRGCGVSDRSRTDLSLDEYVRDIAAIVRGVGGPVDLLASFHGAAPAIAFAAQQPSAVDRLVLWAPYLSGSEWASASKVVLARGILASDYAVWTEAIARWSGLQSASAMDRLTDCFQRNLPQETLEALIRALDTVDVAAAARTLDVPTLVLDARGSTLVPNPLVDAVAEAIPGAVLKRIDGQHALPQFDTSGRSARAVLAWLGFDVMEPAASAASAEVASLTIEVGRDGLWFRMRDSPAVDLRRRRTLSAILAALADVHQSAPGTALTVEQLLEVAWPNTRLQPSAAAHRVYVAIAELRKLGLRGALTRHGAGYLIEPGVQLQRSPDANIMRKPQEI